MPCLEPDTLAALFSGSLSERERGRVDVHVDECGECRRLVAAIARGAAGATASDRTGVDAIETAEHGSAGSPRHVSLGPGDRVGRYVIEGFLGAGAMGAVYRAQDPELGRAVALKIVRAGGAHELEVRARRLAREAQAMAKLSHPNIVPIYDVGRSGELMFIAMKEVEGESLRQRLTTKEISVADALRLLRDAGRGLEAAHRAGIVHRDLKPDNILIDASGTALVGDFGLAHVPDDLRAAAVDDDAASGPAPARTGPGAFRTVEGTILGTPAYMAPELRQGGKADARSDQYSFAVTLAEALGVRPGERDGGGRVPRRVRRVLGRALADDPARRFPSMTELLAALEPRVTWPRAAMGGAVLAAAIGAVVVARGGGAEDRALACKQAAEARVDQVWSPATRASIVDHAAALEAPGAAAVTAVALEHIDGYASDWAAMRRDACEATRVRGEQSAALLDLRMTCLDERLIELGVVVRRLGALDASQVGESQRLTAMLGDLDQCAHAGRLEGRAADPAATLALRETLAEAHASALFGSYDEADGAARAAAAEARAADLPALEAEALMVSAMARARKREPGYIEGFHQALAIGQRLGDAAIRVDALIALLADAAIDPARASEVTLLVRLIEAGLDELPGPQHLRRGKLAGNLSNHHHDLGDFAKAEETAVAAREAFEAALGPVHPYTLMARDTLARVFLRQSRYDEALAVHDETLAVMRQAYGDEHPLMVPALLSRGVVLAQAQRRAEARASFERALALAEAVHGPEHPQVGVVLRKVAYLALDDDPAAARDAFARAVTIFEASSGEHPALGSLLVGLGEAQLEAGDPAAAVATLERGFGVWGDSRIDAHLIPTARFALARALWQSGGDRRRARRLALEAREEYLAQKGPWLPLAGEVATWLAAHR